MDTLARIVTVFREKGISTDGTYALTRNPEYAWLKSVAALPLLLRRVTRGAHRPPAPGRCLAALSKRVADLLLVVASSDGAEDEKAVYKPDRLILAPNIVHAPSTQHKNQC